MENETPPGALPTPTIAPEAVEAKVPQQNMLRALINKVLSVLRGVHINPNTSDFSRFSYKQTYMQQTTTPEILPTSPSQSDPNPLKMPEHTIPITPSKN